ncbi:MAG: trypsin-like peptidase domain-containing protein [Cellulomonadaceae bacterium]
MSRRAAGTTAAALTLLLAGCGVLPPMPEPLPDSVVPSVTSAPRAEDPGALSPDGVDSARRMTVRIRNIGCAELSTGSGFAIDATTLVTNRHVVEGSESLQLLTYDGRDVSAAAASSASLADLAIVRTAEELPAYGHLSDHDPAPGDPVTVVGYPEGGQLTVTSGTVLGTVTDPLHENLGEVLVTDAPVEPGSSGSAALDESGAVIGVVYAKTDDGRSLVVPVSTLRATLEDESAFAELAPCS